MVTNPPYSLFREYIAQLMEYDKKFLIIGSMNAITCKEIFPLLKDNKVWIGNTCFISGAEYFMGNASLYDAWEMPNPKPAYMKDRVFYWRVNDVHWFTDLDNQKQ